MLSKRTQYALRAMMYIASNQNNNKIGVNFIAEELAIPKQFLSKILQELVINGLLHSSKGKKGGFYLTNKNLNSNLRQIIEIFDGDSFFKGCVIGLEQCSSENPCALHAATAIYRNDIKKNLEVNSLKELAIQIHDKKLSI
jgi:Rrf2 family iron-sulfur cluster assembly transcriptional regulator